MFTFLFKTTTYYILLKKFRHQIILVILSLIAISFINGIYEDIYKVAKVSNKENLFTLLLIKWFLVLCIVGYNLYKLKQIKLSDEEKKEILTSEPKSYSPSIQKLLEKETLLSTTDIILEKYKK
ncbi:MAG: hypothetical protein PHN18_10415 [Sulfurospirillaceae bacterium]|nr:hypothetical protein [Sulfurospirillaceae bacterium]MDD2827447.1 hypothetical protein [Sulfurospirillaceae bacterium]